MFELNETTANYIGAQHTTPLKPGMVGTIVSPGYTMEVVDRAGAFALVRKGDSFAVLFEGQDGNFHSVNASDFPFMFEAGDMVLQEYTMFITMNKPGETATWFPGKKPADFKPFKVN